MQQLFSLSLSLYCLQMAPGNVALWSLVFLSPGAEVQSRLVQAEEFADLLAAVQFTVLIHHLEGEKKGQVYTVTLRQQSFYSV